MSRRRLKRNSDPSRVVGYARVSTDAQADEGQSLGAQNSAVESYCSMRGLELLEVIVDPGVSAGKPLATRAGGQRLAQLLDTRRVGGVVALKLDRLFRSAVDALVTVEQWDARNIALHLIDLGGASLDTSTAIGRLFLTMTSGFAELERNLASERTALALQRKIANAERVGRVPYGYRVAADGVHIEPDAVQQATLKRLRHLRAQGMTYKGIADLLNGEGVPPPRATHGGRQSTRWYPSSLHCLLNKVMRNQA